MVMWVNDFFLFSLPMSRGVAWRGVACGVVDGVGWRGVACEAGRVASPDLRGKVT